MRVQSYSFQNSNSNGAVGVASVLEYLGRLSARGTYSLFVLRKMQVILPSFKRAIVIDIVLRTPYRRLPSLVRIVSWLAASEIDAL
jgi:predicted transcriptional regulator